MNLQFQIISSCFAHGIAFEIRKNYCETWRYNPISWLHAHYFNLFLFAFVMSVLVAHSLANPNRANKSCLIKLSSNPTVVPRYVECIFFKCSYRDPHAGENDNVPRFWSSFDPCLSDANSLRSGYCWPFVAILYIHHSITLTITWRIVSTVL